MSKPATGRVLGAGGVFFRSRDPQRLGQWYAEYLGIDVESRGGACGTSFPPAAPA